ncbi:hypothetical protein [Lamprocystis purpurea]|uniref:hypothetical protein n=1 Tax=Lamprocystis purpurea TaxID=61598 RepID=UPI00039E0C69|nr:hypothetical protein [Lamprocystis purpurea]
MSTLRRAGQCANAHLQATRRVGIMAKYPRAQFSPAKDEMLAIAILRESVVKHDIRPLLDKLLPLAATREAAIAWEGKVTFFFDGWDQDPRETAEIPAIRAYFLDTTSSVCPRR